MVLAAIGVLLFVSSVHRGDHDQAERMSLLPLEDDEANLPPAPSRTDQRANRASHGAPRGADGPPQDKQPVNDKEGFDP